MLQRLQATLTSNCMHTSGTLGLMSVAHRHTAGDASKTVDQDLAPLRPGICNEMGGSWEVLQQVHVGQVLHWHLQAPALRYVGVIVRSSQMCSSPPTAHVCRTLRQPHALR